MIQIRAKLKVPRSAYKLEVKGKLLFEQHGDHFHARLDSGEEVEVRLTRGEVLRAGDLVTASDGRVLEVVTETPVEVDRSHGGNHHHGHDHDH